MKDYLKNDFEEYYRCECLDAFFPVVPYCIDLIAGPFMVFNEEVIKVIRAKK